MNGIVLRIPASSYPIARKGRPILLRAAMGIFGYLSQKSVVAPVPGDNQLANGLARFLRARSQITVTTPTPLREQPRSPRSGLSPTEVDTLPVATRPCELSRWTVRSGVERRIAHRGSSIGVSQRVNRGGSWNNKPANVRSAQRARSVVRTVRCLGNFKSFTDCRNRGRRFRATARSSGRPHRWLGRAWRRRRKLFVAAVRQ